MSGLRWRDAEVRRALGLREGGNVGEPVFTGVSTDSRATRPGDLYVALVGQRFDGHDFLADAAKAGARGAVVSRPIGDSDVGVLYHTDDTLVALGLLAAHRRASLDVAVVGITGSSGKTSTKDLIAGALGGARRVHATRGNFNNRVGLPLTLLAAPDDVDAVVLEMGTSEPGEIATLAGIARPSLGVLTTVGESHLEKLGSLEGVLDEKLDLLRALPAGGGAVVGDVPAVLPARARAELPGVRVAGWSERADEDLRPKQWEVDAEGAYRFRWGGQPVRLSAPGRHVVNNALLALAAAEMLGVEAEASAAGVSAVRAGSMRGERRTIGSLTLLVDCYNANPQSVDAALGVLEEQSGYRARLAVLGSMLELGTDSEGLHARVLDGALGRNLDAVVATGAFARAAARLAAPRAVELVVEEDPERAYAALLPYLKGGEVILLKASRGVELESLVPRFEKDFGAAEED